MTLPPYIVPHSQEEILILYEDEDLLLVRKPDLLLSIPGRHPLNKDCLISRLQVDYPTASIVHRLDRFTTGVMVAAKSDTAHWRLGHQFQDRTVGKRYLAVVHGVVKRPTDLIDLPLGRHPRIFDRYAVRHDDSGKEARTVYRVVERYDGFTLVELELLTGRTHQIRVHLAETGHPIVGDDYYGGRHLSRDMIVPRGQDDPGVARDAPLMARQALHAARLEFEHPIVGDRRIHQAPLWADMAELVAVLRRHRHAEPTRTPGVLVEVPTADR